MLIRDVITLAAQMLGREDLLGEIPGDTAEGEVGALLRCYNIVENEIALDYFPLINTERLNVSGGKITFTQFSYTPVEIKKVTNTSDMGVPFSVYSAYLEVPKGYSAVNVTYSYVPEKKELGGETAFTERISARLLAFGVVSEYCLATGRYEEGKLWGERYRDALRAVGILRRPLSVRSRRGV